MILKFFDIFLKMKDLTTSEAFLVSRDKTTYFDDVTNGLTGLRAVYKLSTVTFFEYTDNLHSQFYAIIYKI